MRILIIGPSDTKSHGGMATVINGIRNSKILNEKYDIDIFPSFIDGNIIIRFIYSLIAYLKFLIIYKKYDLFHIHTASFGSTFRKRYYLKAIKRAGKKAIVHIHGAKYLIFYVGLNSANQKKVVDFLNHADMVLALSDEWKRKFEETFHIMNCKSLPNGIDAEEFVNIACDLEQHKNEFVFLGRLGERKGVYDLVNAIEIAVKQNPNIKLYIAGDGEVDQIRALVADKGLQDVIDVVGWVDFAGKLSLLKKSATLVLPSYNEGLPMAVLEGMASGKAIISTRVGAIPEVIKEENGILITAGDVQQLADALIKCSKDLNMLKAMSKANTKKINDEFSIKIMHQKLEEYYGAVMKE